MASKQENRVKIGRMSDLAANGRLMASVGGREVVVIQHDGRLYAYENNCPHLGGPVCQGKLIPNVEAMVDADGSVSGDRFVPEDMLIACPWHGFEFHLETGVCAGDARLRLRRHDVVRDADDLYVVTPG